MTSSITPCIWFDTEGEEAAKLYTSLFPNSKITQTSYYGPDQPGPEGKALTVEFELDGTQFTALNGGPQFTPNEAISFQISCRDQDEVDHYWDGLVEGGGEHGPCGWLKDRFGVSWQVIPEALPRLLSGPDKEKANRVMQAMLKMGKLEVAELERAAEGVPA